MKIFFDTYGDDDYVGDNDADDNGSSDNDGDDDDICDTDNFHSDLGDMMVMMIIALAEEMIRKWRQLLKITLFATANHHQL